MRYENRGTMDDQKEQQEVIQQELSIPPRRDYKGSEILPFGPPRST